MQTLANQNEPSINNILVISSQENKIRHEMLQIQKKPRKFQSNKAPSPKRYRNNKLLDAISSWPPDQLFLS